MKPLITLLSLALLVGLSACTQETQNKIGREINTLGSKSNQSGMQRIVVQMKDELEQIKEQILNVL